MRKVCIFLVFLCCLLIQPACSENVQVPELDIFEQNLGIQPTSSAIIPRIEAIENALFGTYCSG